MSVYPSPRLPTGYSVGSIPSFILMTEAPKVSNKTSRYERVTKNPTKNPTYNVLIMGLVLFLSLVGLGQGIEFSLSHTYSL